MYIKWNLTKKCTLSCKFCHNSIERKSWNNDMTVKQIEQIVRNLSENPNIEGISLLGGDPLEYEHILTLAEFLEAYDIPFGFITAGEKIFTGQYDPILFNKNLKFIGLSIDSLNPRTVKVARNKDILQEQLDSLDHILKLKKDYQLLYEVFTNTILMSVNQFEIIDLIKYFRQKSINKIQILEYRHTKKELHDFSVDNYEEHRFLEELTKYIQENATEDFSQLELCFLPEPGKDYIRKLTSNNNISLGTSSKCPIFRDTVFVSNDGFVYPCDNYKPFFRNDPITDEPEKIYKIENLLEQSLYSIVQNNEYFKEISTLVQKTKHELFGNLEPCNKCHHLLDKCFPCLQYARNEKKQSYVYDKKCKYYLDISG